METLVIILATTTLVSTLLAVKYHYQAQHYKKKLYRYTTYSCIAFGLGLTGNKLINRLFDETEKEDK